MKTTRTLRPTPALRDAVARYLEHVAADHPARDAVVGLARGVLLGRARIVCPSLRRASDEDVILRAVEVCA
jgi:hypothetical protein